MLVQGQAIFSVSVELRYGVFKDLRSDLDCLKDPKFIRMDLLKLWAEFTEKQLSIVNRIIDDEVQIGVDKDWPRQASQLKLCDLLVANAAREDATCLVEVKILINPIAQQLVSARVLDVAQLLNAIVDGSAIFVEMCRFLTECLFGSVVTLLDKVFNDLIPNVSIRNRGLCARRAW